MCPLYFYQSRGECIPTFTSFGGIYFSICLEIKPTQSQQLKSVLPVLTLNLDRVARSFFNNYSFEIWSPDEEKEKKIIVALFNIISTDPDLISLLNRIDLLLKSMADLRFQTEQGIVDIGFKLTIKDDYRFVDENNMIWGFAGIILNAYKREPKLAMALSEMEILPTMGCYRILVESPGYKPDMPTAKYKRISSWYENSTWFVKYITCLADAIPIDFGTTDTYMFKGFAEKTLNPIDNIQDPKDIATNTNVSKNDTGNPINNIQEPKNIFIKDNVSKNDTNTTKRIEDSASSSVGVREESLSVVAFIILDVIMLTIVI